MKTTALRIYGKEDLRLETFELPAIREDEILARVMSDSICMSSYKAALQGAEHKRVPADIAENPIILGHEFCGEILEVGAKWKDKYKPGGKFVMQAALNYKGSLAAIGYSYKYAGGDATYVILPPEAMIMDCVMPYAGDSYYFGSLAEPMSCIVGAFNVNYHTTLGSYEHKMGIVDGGKAAILAGAGPMGLGMIDYAIHRDRHPSLLVVTDIDDARLARAASIYTVENARENGVELHYVNTSNEGAEEHIRALTGGGGFDDIFVLAPVKPVVEQADRLLGYDGCLNFFAGPSNHEFRAEFNFFNVHYAFTHVAGNTGGNTNDIREALELMSSGRINPSAMITHVGGLNAARETTLNLPRIPGGKKLIYTHIDMPLFALSELESMRSQSPLFDGLADIVASHSGLWSAEAEKFLLSHSEIK